jgi:hypothetical protein
MTHAFKIGLFWVTRPKIWPVGNTMTSSFHDNPATLVKKFLPLQENSAPYLNVTFFLVLSKRSQLCNTITVSNFMRIFSFNAFICKEYRTKSFFFIWPLFGPIWDNPAQIWPRICQGTHFFLGALWLMQPNFPPAGHWRGRGGDGAGGGGGGCFV